MRIDGPPEDVRVEAHLTGIDDTVGTIDANLKADLMAERLSWTGEVDIAGLEAAQLYEKAPGDATLHGHVDVEGSGTSWPDDVVITGTFTGTEPIVALGYAVNDVQGAFELRDGKAVVKDLAADAVVGKFTVNGGLDVLGGKVDARVTGPLNLHRLRRFGMPKVVSGTGYLDMVIDGNLLDEVPEAGHGTVTFGPIAYGEGVTVTGTTARFSFTASTETQEVDAVVVVRGGPIDAFGAEVGGFASDRIEIHAAAKTKSATAKGQLRALDARWGKLFVADGLATDFTAVVDGKTKAVDVGADVVFLPFHLLDLQATGGTASVRLSREEVSFTVDVEQRGRELLSTGGRLDMGTLELGLDHLRAAPTETVWTAMGRQHLHLTRQGFDHANLYVSSPSQGSLKFTGALGVEGDVDGHVAVGAFDLAIVAETFPSLAKGVQGMVSLDAKVQGPARSPQVRGTLSGQGLGLDGIAEKLGVSGRFENTVGEPGVHAHLDFESEGTPFAWLEGQLPVVVDPRPRAMIRITSSQTLRDCAIDTISESVIFGLITTDIATSLLRSRTSSARASLLPSRASWIFWNTVIFWISA